MKTLGIVGGIGPESTIDYYKSILDGIRARRPDGPAPRIVIVGGRLVRSLYEGPLAAGRGPEIARTR